MREPKLPLPIAQVLADPPPPRAQELWDRIEQARVERRRARALRARKLGSLAAVLLLCAASVAWLGGGPAPQPLTLRDQGAMPGVLAGGARSYRFVDLSDGSRITLAQGAQLDVLVASPRQVGLVLRAGRARFDVRPKGPRAWRVEADGVSVEVVGTSFVVERRRDAVDVAVLHGVVVVRAAGLRDGVRRLGAGERVTVASSTGASAAHTGAPARKVEPEAAAEAQAAAEAEPPSPNDSELHPEAEAEAEAEARTRPAAAAEPEPPAAATPRARRAAQPALSHDDALTMLWREVDAARLRRAPRDALAALARISALAPESGQRALAAFTAGKLALDELADPARAAQELARALALGLPSPLDGDARRRLVAAELGAGHVAEACAAARALGPGAAAGYPELDGRCSEP